MSSNKTSLKTQNSSPRKCCDRSYCSHADAGRGYYCNMSTGGGMSLGIDWPFSSWTGSRNGFSPIVDAKLESSSIPIITVLVTHRVLVEMRKTFFRQINTIPLKIYRC